MTTQLTKQEAFNLVWERAKDPRRSMGSSTVADQSFCAYRGSHGVKCFVGVLIPDEEYHPCMEGERASYLLTNGNLPPSLDPADVEFYDTMQRVHDDFETPPSQWHDLLRIVAAEYNLTVPQ